MSSVPPPPSVSNAYQLLGDAAKQWYSVRNRSGEEIPPFGVMQLAQVDKDNSESNYLTQYESNDSIVWNVKKCDEYGENLCDNSLFLINGRYKIAKDGYGRGSWSYPLQVLHDGTGDDLPNFMECGPVRDSWNIWRSGRGFRCISHDAASPYTEHDGKLHTVWVQPSPLRIAAYGRSIGSLGSSNPMPAGSWAQFGTWDGFVMQDEEPEQDRQLLVTTNIEAVTTDDGVPGWKVLYPGRYLVSLSAVIYCADSATRGTRLALRMFVWRSGVQAWWDTRYQAHRYQAVEEADYSVIKGIELEQVCFCGVVPLDAGDVIAFKNDSSVALSVDAPSLTVERIAPYDDNKLHEKRGVAWP